MSYALATDSRLLWPGRIATGLLILLVLTACSGKNAEKPGKTVLNTRSGETGIQVTESEIDGTQVVRVTTTFRGEESNIELAIDQPVYDIEIPLSIQQTRPAGAGGGTGSGAGAVQDILTAQYLEKAQSAMLDGNYNEALKQVNLVLTVNPDHVKAREMKGSVYYAMGSYQLANEEWERVLTLDPSNEEVRGFMDFTQNQQGAPQPPLPGSLQQGQPGTANEGSAQ